MNRQENFHALQLNDEASFDNEVDAVGAFQSDAAIDNWKADLVFKAQSSLRQFVVQTRIARTLEDTGTESAMHLHRGPDHYSTRLVWLHESVR